MLAHPSAQLGAQKSVVAYSNVELERINGNYALLTALEHDRSRGTRWGSTRSR